MKTSIKDKELEVNQKQNGRQQEQQQASLDQEQEGGPAVEELSLQELDKSVQEALQSLTNLDVREKILSTVKPRSVNAKATPAVEVYADLCSSPVKESGAVAAFRKSQQKREEQD